MSQQSEQQWTKHVALGGSCAQCAGKVVPNLDCLKSLGQEVQDPVAKGGIQAQQGQLCQSGAEE